MSESAGANAPKPSSSVKLVLLGEAAVGKVRLSLPRYTDTIADTRFCRLQSSLVLRFVNNDFQENKEPTIGGKKIPPFPQDRLGCDENIWRSLASHTVSSGWDSGAGVTTG